MNTSQSRTSPPKAISPDEAIRGLTAGVASTDAARAEGYGQLSAVRAAKQKQLARRETLLALKYGANHPRVAEAKLQQGVNRQLTQQIEVIRVQTANPPPQADPRGYIFHGYVRNRQRQPQPQLTVALYDEKGWFRDLGYGCTDETGYFLLRYTGQPRTEVPPQTGPNQPSDPLQPKPAPVEGQIPGISGPGRDKITNDPATGRQTRDDDSKNFEIRVYNGQQKLVYRDPVPLVARLGQVDFRELIIDDDGCDCTPPPGGTDGPPPPAPPKPIVTPRVPVTAPPKPPIADTRPATTAEAVPSSSSTPLENIRGVGPKTANKLRASGIKDIEGLEQVDTKKLVDLAGLDKSVTQPKKSAQSPKPTRRKAKRK